ncbi:MAG: Stk1 family PASTA domain-containing Ser/Thr kinase [Lachnospiraceae bacterium]
MIAMGMFVADRYEIVEKIGAGGMSDVYKARDHVLGRFVAVKILKNEFSEDVNFVTKFRTEAQSAASLEHPNIVNIYDVGSEAGIYYIVMEFVEGVTLKTYIEKKGQLSYKEAVSIAIQVGRGIEAAHAKHIIHRDIKPQNILISTEGKAKVTDFGIARAVSSNTISADVMGSVHYASPEQARNGFVDGKSDIYSLGIVMYEMVTGRVPYDGDTTVAIAIQHLQDEMVTPSAYAPDLPISFEKIILKCTQKSPDRRYANISDLLIDLKKVLISPNEDFVTIIPSLTQTKTREINETELSQIKNARFVETPERGSESVKASASEDEEDDEDTGMLNPKMEKAVTIAGIVAAVIIFIIVIVLVGNITGLFGSGRTSTETTETELTETQTETETSTEETVAMIDITGMTFDDAKQALSELELGIKKAGTDYSDTIEEGSILSQDVERGEKVEKNTTINVVVSSGPEETEEVIETVSVPDVSGQSESAARSTLTAAGLKVDSVTSEYSSSVDSGDVISQTPTAGSTLNKGDSVSLVVSQGEESISVPYVINMSEAEAISTLEAAGLVVSNNSTEYNDSVPDGEVISQSISSGSLVERGTKIKLVISLGAKINYYTCEATISAPESTNVTSADILLTDKDGNELQSWKGIAIAEFPYTISVTDIEESSTGTITITWYLDDATTSVQTQSVSFTKQ